MENNSALIIFELVKLLGVPVTKSSIVAKIDKIPNNNSLLAITEVLDNLGIGNEAYPLTPDLLVDDYCPLITLLRNDEKKDFVIIKSINDIGARIIKDTGETITVTHENFVAQYTGVVLAVDAETAAGEKDYWYKRTIEFVKKLRLPFLFFTILFLFFGVFQSAGFKGYVTGMLLIKCIGLVTAVLLVFKANNAGSPLYDRLCFKGKLGDCTNSLFSGGTKLFGLLSWADIGVLYFAGTFLALAFNEHVIQIICYLNLLCLPFICYSLFYQGFVIKQWCVLCCIVQVCLALEFLTGFHFLRQPFYPISYKEWYNLAAALLAPAALGIFVAPIIDKAGEVEKMKNAFARFRSNNRLFDKALIEQPAYQVPQPDISIVLGNATSTTVLTIVSNPYCGPCASVHREIDELLEFGKDIQVRLVLTSSPGENETVKHMVSLYKQQGSKSVKKALSDWYSPVTKQYTEWAKKHPVELDAAVYSPFIQAQSEWCEGKIAFTPLLILNGHQLPEFYNVADLKYLIN